MRNQKIKKQTNKSKYWNEAERRREVSQSEYWVFYICFVNAAAWFRFSGSNSMLSNNINAVHVVEFVQINSFESHLFQKTTIYGQEFRNIFIIAAKLHDRNASATAQPNGLLSLKSSNEAEIWKSPSLPLPLLLPLPTTTNPWMNCFELFETRIQKCSTKNRYTQVEHNKASHNTVLCSRVQCWDYIRLRRKQQRRFVKANGHVFQ